MQLTAILTLAAEGGFTAMKPVLVRKVSRSIRL